MGVFGAARRGAAVGGTVVTITGTNLGDTTAVKFGANSATAVKVINDTTVIAKAPAGTQGTTVDVTVTTPIGTSAISAGDKYTYDAVQANASSIGKLIPNVGIANVGGITLIVGQHFTGATSVKFGTKPATSFKVLSDSLILAVAPPAPAGTVDVRVTGPGGTSPITNADRFTYIQIHHRDSASTNTSSGSC